jgi:hypothetical protein
MFCPACGRALSPPPRQPVPYPMHVCATDGIVYDQKRGQWYGVPEVHDRLCCPACGNAMESEPKGGSPRVFFCYQCGTTYDKSRAAWYGLAFHAGPAAP